ncbi:hypothetical protein [Pseudomonas sp. NA-150]|uniref:hypothetical protein n=1 Tax=Pseudomonas sp. NA-150 TaxID=3367525 RepID=UPI0037CB5732
MSVNRTEVQLEAWYALFDDERYRLEDPDGHHATLLHTAQALLRDGAIEWDDWLSLKELANNLFAKNGGLKY